MGRKDPSKSVQVFPNKKTKQNNVKERRKKGRMCFFFEIFRINHTFQVQNKKKKKSKITSSATKNRKKKIEEFQSINEGILK